MSTRQEAAHKPDAASEPTAAPTVPLPKAGERFSNEELHSRYGVPKDGGIRVSRENRCIVLVNLAVDSTGYADADRGTGILYMGENSDRMGIQNQEMTGGNLALSRSKKEGYTVLHFIKEGGAMTFDSRVECDSHEFEPEIGRGGQHRIVISFSLRKIEGGASAQRKHARDVESTKGCMETAKCSAAGEDAETEAVDSPPLTPEEIAAIGDFLSEAPHRSMSKEEFLGIVMDDKKLEERARRLNSDDNCESP